MTCRHAHNRAFTLVEVIVASTIASFVTLVAMGTLHALSQSSAKIQAHCDTVSELRYASSVLSHDLSNLCVSSDPNTSKLVFGIPEDTETEEPVLTFYMISHDKARTGQPESDLYEVEYYLTKAEDKTVLMRRLWPNPNRKKKPGGVLTVLAEGIDMFQIRFHDGQQWRSQWLETQEEMPKLMEVLLATNMQEGKKPFVTSFMIKPVTPSEQNMDQEQVDMDNEDAMTEDREDMDMDWESES